MHASMLLIFVLLVACSADAAEHLIRPGESPQMVLDRAAKGIGWCFCRGA